MTTQTPDEVIHNEHQYAIAGIKGKGLLTPTDFGITPVMISIGCYRGYICQYTFLDHRLYLTELIVRTEGNQYPLIDGISAIVDNFFLFGKYEGLLIPCRFSGGLLLVRDRIDSRIHGVTPTPASYHNVLEIVLKDGAMVDVIDHSKKLDDIRNKMDEMMKIMGTDQMKHKDWETPEKIEWSFVQGYEEQPPF